MLALLFILVDLAVSAWDPMVNSRRFAKDDFTKTVYHHGGDHSGPVFFGNSAVTGAYIEEKSTSGLVEMGLSYGKPSDLQGIIERNLYQIEKQLVIGIDVHTMLDKLDTDPNYRWLKPWYKPYLYTYGPSFKDAGKELVLNGLKGSLAYEPRWIDKELYFGRKSDEDLNKSQERYNNLFNWMTMPDFEQNLGSLEWVINYAERNNLDLKVIWMPYNPKFPHPPYMNELKYTIDGILKERNVPTLDLMDKYEAKYFHDIVHLNREEGAPLFTREVDAWLASVK